MRIKFTCLLVSLLFLIGSYNCSNQDYDEDFSFSSLKGPYLGQKPPGSIPEIFAPGIISFGHHELRISFSPDGDEAFYAFCDGRYKLRHMVHLKTKDGVWAEPELAAFAGTHHNAGAAFSPDGTRMYFTSNRSYPAEVGTKKLDIWYIERQGSAWSEPVKLPDTINSDDRESFPSIAANGNLYFSAYSDERKPFMYFSEFKDGDWLPRKKIKIDIKPDAVIGSPFIAPDESYLLFQSILPEGLGSNDLYVTFRKEDGSWGAPINLGDKINSKYNDIGARVTFDGKYLFFSSYKEYDVEEFRGKSYKELLKLYKSPQNGYATLYWVDASVITDLQSKNVK